VKEARKRNARHGPRTLARAALGVRTRRALDPLPTPGGQLKRRTDGAGKHGGNYRVRRLAWSVASVFAVPALVLGDKGASPVDLVKRSASALKRTWGEGLMGYVGFELGGGVIGLASLGLFAAAGAASFALGSFLVLGAVGVLWIVGIVALAYLSHAAGHVYKAALYLYASEGTVTASYDQDMFAEAWRMRKA
jgi:hypothetical protein